MAPALLLVILAALAVAIAVVAVLLLVCRPWRFLLPRSPFMALRSYTTNPDDIERPFLPENADRLSGQGYVLSRGLATESSTGDAQSLCSPRRSGALSTKNESCSLDFHRNQVVSLVVEKTLDTAEVHEIGQTLDRSVSRPNEEIKRRRVDDKYIGQRDSSVKGSCLTLEVIDGLSRGLRCTRLSTDTTTLPLTIGRTSMCDLVLHDKDVSGKHVLINWNNNNSSWELVDAGSLNGTSVNSKSICNKDSGSRRRSDPFVLRNEDIIIFGSSSTARIQITVHMECGVPRGVGMASDPMTAYRGGKSLPMEDVSYCQWPLPGDDKFGLFGIFDGHGGAEAAKAASKKLPENVANILSDPERRGRTLSLCDASDVLQDAFSLTEAAMNHQYEGCTATALLIWFHKNEFFAQCANLGDSACFININGKHINMTEDHRISSANERARMRHAGKPLKDGESRICGINIARMLGDKFLKEQDERFSSEPYVSQVVRVSEACTAFSMLASDGLWDVMGTKKAAQLVLQVKKSGDAPEDSAEKIANSVLKEAKALRTKDNTSIIYLDFDALRTDYSPAADSEV